MKYVRRSVSSTLSIGGSSYPVLEYMLALQVNSLPQCQITIPMGVGWDKKGLAKKPVSVDKIKAGDKLEFTAKVGSFEASFQGVVGSAGLDIQLSNTGGSHGKFVVTGEHKLGELGGLSVMQRAFCGSGVPTAVTIDQYRNTLREGKNGHSAFFEGMLGNGVLMEAFDDIVNGTGGAPQAVIKTLIGLYKSESYTKTTSSGATGSTSTSVRAADGEAIALLTDLLERIWGGKVKFNGGQQDAKQLSLFNNKLFQSMLMAWPGSNGLSLLIQALDQVFYMLAPRLDGEVDVRNNCPVMRKADVDIPADHIHKISINSHFEFTPITGIRIFKPTTPEDATDGNAQMYFIQYPEKPGDEKGLYQYVNSGKYTPWLCLEPMQPHNTKNPPKQKGTLSVSKPKGEKSTKPKDKTAKPISPEAKSDYYLDIGKAVYGQQKWRSNAIVITIAHTDKVQVGDVAKVDLSKNSDALAAGIPKGIYYGQIYSVNLAGGQGFSTMQLRLNCVRSESDNKKYGLQERPIYAHYGPPKKK